MAQDLCWSYECGATTKEECMATGCPKAHSLVEIVGKDRWIAIPGEGWMRSALNEKLGGALNFQQESFYPYPNFAVVQCLNVSKAKNILTSRQGLDLEAISLFDLLVASGEQPEPEPEPTPPAAPQQQPNNNTNNFTIGNMNNNNPFNNPNPNINGNMNNNNGGAPNPFTNTNNSNNPGFNNNTPSTPPHFGNSGNSGNGSNNFTNPNNNYNTTPPGKFGNNGPTSTPSSHTQQQPPNHHQQQQQQQQYQYQQPPPQPQPKPQPQQLASTGAGKRSPRVVWEHLILGDPTKPTAALWNENLQKMKLEGECATWASEVNRILSICNDLVEVQRTKLSQYRIRMNQAFRQISKYSSNAGVLLLKPHSSYFK